MGKPKKSLFEQQSKKTKRKPQISKMNSDDDQQVNDVMAWGRKRENYYKQDEDEYSSLSEEEKEAEQIYKNKYDNYMNDQDVYDIPEEKKEEGVPKKTFQAEIEDEEEQNLPQEYVSQELEWVLELFKDLQFYEENNLLKIYQKLLKSYLTVIISIKQLKIPYIQYHPIIPMAVEIKTNIAKLMKKLNVKEDQENGRPQDQKKKVKSDKKITVEEESFDDQMDGEDDEEIVFGDDDEQEDFDDDFDSQEDNEQNDWDKSDQPAKKSNKKPPLKPYSDHCTQASKTQKSEHQKGLEFYNQMKAATEKQKKIKKQEKREERKVNKKPAFKQLKENQGRFASELILKNKGLMKKRKKIQGNSRVKLRKKYQKKKAIHRARSGHFIRQNPGRAYEGENNIRTGKIAGVKLK